MKNRREKILICGVLPPPYFGHSTTYKVLMQSPFAGAFDITFLNMHFWSYRRHKKVTLAKIMQLFYYYVLFVVMIVLKRPRYILYNISFDKMPLLKDLLFCATAKALGSKIILHDHGQYLKTLYESSGILFKRAVLYLLKCAAASIVLGEKTRHVYEGFFPVEKTFSVHGGVEDTKVTHAAVPPNRHSNYVRVLYFSFVSVSKGIWTALKAIPLVVEKNPQVRFTIAGPVESGALQKEMEAFIRDHALQGHVEYLGYIGDELQRTKIFRSSDIFIFPTHRDVFGLVLLHAMAEGLPVIASIEGAIPEIVRDGQEGYLFPKEGYHSLARHILRLAEDRALRQKMSAAGRARYLEYYTVEQYGRRMIDAFNRIHEMCEKIGEG